MTPNTDLPPSDAAEAEQGPSAGCAPAAGSESEIRVLCSQCGYQITSGNVFHYGEARALMPIFCSEACAENYVPEVLTVAKLKSLREWLPAGPKNVTAQQPPETAY